MKLELVKEKEGVKVYQGNNCRIYYGEENKVFGDNNTNPKELIYLLKGELEVTIEDKIKLFKAPEKIEIEANTYHKLEAKTNVIFEVYTK